MVRQLAKCEINARFILVQPEDAARMWSDAELRTVLEENLKLWAGTVDGKLDSLYIIINRSEPASSPA